MTDEQIRVLEERGATVTAWRDPKGVVGYTIAWPVVHTASGARVYRLGANTNGISVR